MIKWVIIFSVALVVTIFVIRIITVMLKTEKESNQSEQQKSESDYTPQRASIDVGSASNSIVTDMSANAKNLDNVKAEYDFDMPNNSGFLDDLDPEFIVYSSYARSGKRRKIPDNFDFEGDRADEYIPDSPEFSYIPPRRHKNKKKPVSTELNDMSTELKVLMLSDIFDRKFFD